MHSRHPIRGPNTRPKASKANTALRQWCDGPLCTLYPTTTGMAESNGETVRAYLVTELVNAMETDAAIVRRAIEGDERAMRLLWNQHAPHVDAVVRRLAGDPDLAQDIAQEVWIQIFRALPSWRGDAKFSTWIHRVAINRTLNAMRRVKRLSTVETAIEEDSAVVEQDAERSMLAQTIAEATQRLSPGARTVFLLHDVEGYTHEEIATELGITAGGSKSQLFKARAKLRRLLAPLVDIVSPDLDRSYAAP
ncbi:MAG TPA: RNA polymerase subunit sigma-70 [Gemmatimonas aurantiaca]|uniref:RNA polymerase subunit sigma-70 n=1 Tax=Gemmatimonas aurantiaca TaxID=173480 RepID=A0A3D4V9Z2_9BACT|nr:RNA polymerase subunit sigma-70 [Gemmatimonas aurantiaca]